MVRHGQIVESHGYVGYVSPMQRLRRHARSVQVQVIDGGHEVDRFQVANPRILRSELRSIYRHLSKHGGVVRLEGVEEEWLPLGIDRVRHEMKLDNVADALFFLAA